MAKLQLLLAGLHATSALASPWSRYQKRGGGGGWGGYNHGGHGDRGGEWGKQTTASADSPKGYGLSASETSPWGYGSTPGCEAVTVTETQGMNFRYAFMLAISMFIVLD